MITVKGKTDMDRFIIGHIIDPSVPNIEFKNITFDCKTIKDASGHIFVQQVEWIPVSERLPEEKEWIGTEKFGTTMSDEIIITFEVDGHRFVRVMCLQNGDLGLSDKHTMDAFYNGWRMIAWMPLPEPYREDEKNE